MLAGVVVLVAAGYAVFALVAAVPAPSVIAVRLAGAFPGSPPPLAWPIRGEAAVAVEGVGVLGVRGSGRPTPIASIAKVMSAYVVLRDHPLRGGASGPPITVSPADVAAYRADKAAGESVVVVRAGERLTEREALEALLLPSGDNIATLLARWDAGSEPGFVAKMNVLARKLGLSHTRYADAAGTRAGTTSTAADQVGLAMVALEVPVFRQIVAMPQVTLPVAGRQFNVDGLLGRDGIVGVKTGSTPQAGGCFVFAAHELLAGRTVTVVGAVLHQPATRAQPSIIEAALHASTRLLGSARGVLLQRRVIRGGETLAWVKSGWAPPVAVTAAASVSLVGWPGLRIEDSVETARHLTAPLAAGRNVGVAVVAVGRQHARVRLLASRALPSASLGWRLAHP